MKKIFIIIPIILLVTASHANAATMRLVANPTGAMIHQLVRIDLKLDTEGENANAVQGEIQFPSGQFALSSILDGESPVSFWIEPPHIVGSGTIAFAGIIPGGFSGQASSVLAFIINPLTSGSADITITSATILRNDGQGSVISLKISGTSVFISNTVATSTVPKPSLILPESFTPIVAQDPNVYNGNYFLVFSTTDKGSGIDHYEILEIPTGFSPNIKVHWQTATSPYLLEDQSLSSDIYVRAVDHAGNFIVEKLPAAHPVPRIVQRGNILWIVIGLLIAGCLAVFLVLRRRRI